MKLVYMLPTLELIQRESMENFHQVVLSGETKQTEEEIPYLLIIEKNEEQ